MSWIWDVEFEPLVRLNIPIICTGDRVWDMALRIKYAQNSKLKIQKEKFIIEADYKKTLKIGLQNSGQCKTLYILPTYSAMLDIRKILTGRRIL